MVPVVGQSRVILTLYYAGVYSVVELENQSFYETFQSLFLMNARTTSMANEIDV